MFKLKSLSIVTNFTSEILEKLYMSILFPSQFTHFFALKNTSSRPPGISRRPFGWPATACFCGVEPGSWDPAWCGILGSHDLTAMATRLPRLDGWYWLNSWIWWLIWFDGSSKIDWLIIGWIIGFDSSQNWWLIWFYNGRSYEKMDDSTNINHPRMENGWILVDKKYLPKFMVDFIL